jgi:hypothetical protein
MKRKLLYIPCHSLNHSYSLTQSLEEEEEKQALIVALAETARLKAEEEAEASRIAAELEVVRLKAVAGNEA